MDTIVILGTGNVGAALGRRLAIGGYNVVFGSRDPFSDSVRRLVEENPHAHQAHSIAAAVRQGNVVILAAPWKAVPDVIEAAGTGLDGKVLVDCTNPLNATFDGLELESEPSAAETIARWALGAKVVKAFNTVSVATMQNPDYAGIPATLFYCGDDHEAKQTVRQLIATVGMEPIDAGNLANSRYLEAMAMLYIHLAVHQRMGGNCALKMLRR